MILTWLTPLPSVRVGPLTKSTLSRRARRVVMLSNAGNERFESSSVLLMGLLLLYEAERKVFWTAVRFRPPPPKAHHR